MFEKIATSWEFAKMSYGIIWDFKRLIIFPLVSSIALLIVSASFLLPLWGTGTIDQWMTMMDAEQGATYQSPLFWLVTFAFYFCNYFVIVYFNAGLIACTMAVMRGEVPKVADGLAMANKRLPQILAWAFVSALIGVLLKAIENAHEKAGAIIAAILGTAWSIMTFFVVPLLVMEGIGPVEAVKRSVDTMKQTWGEALVGHFSMGLLGFLLFLPVLAVLIVLGYLAAGNTSALFAVIALGVVLVGLYAAVTTAADTIFKALLYSYATGKALPEDLSTAEYSMAFVAKD